MPLYAVILFIIAVSSLDPWVAQSLKQWGKVHADEEYSFQEGGDLQLQLFDESKYPNARCLDGTMAGFYHALNSSSNDWVIYLQGGGLCVEPVDCEARKKNHLGSNKYWTSTMSDTKNVCSQNSENPFSTWNRIYLPYCTGDVHIGVLTEADEFGFHFAGHLIIEALLDELFLSKKPHVSKVVLTGGSAGGIGTMHNADYVASQLATLPSAPQFWASPQGGFYFPSERLLMYPEMYMNISIDFAPVAASYLYAFFGKPYLDESCTDAHKHAPHQCWNQAVHYPHISTPLFIAENMYDSNQIGAVLGVDWYPKKDKVNEYKQYFGTLMRKVGANRIKRHDGVFMPSCYQHTSNLCMLNESPKILGKTYQELLIGWMYQSNVTQYHYVDFCGDMPCNSYCKC